jgi:hypothetical protein
MRIVTLLGIMVAFALSTAGCNRSSGTSHARHDSVGGEHAKSKEGRAQAEREHERKGKADTWEYEEEFEGQDAEDHRMEKQRGDEELEDSGERSRDVLDNETQRQYRVLEDPNPTNP